MTKELDDALVRDFPLLYADRHAPMTKTCMCWGFDVPDAWEPVIRKLSAQVEKILATIPEEYRPRASQVKEKFGGLRFYMTGYSAEIDKLIGEAEKACWEICAECGKPATVTAGGWITRLCAECAEGRGVTEMEEDE